MKHLIFLLFIVLAFLATRQAWGATYYISNTGDDTNNGTTTSTPFAHIPGGTGCSNNCSTAASALAGGDAIYLNRGDTWSNTTVTIPSGGTSSSQITLSSYGTGAKPIISGPANNPAITVTSADRGYWTIDGLDLRSTGINASYSPMVIALFFNYWAGGGNEMGVVPGWIIKNCDFNASLVASGPSILIQNNTFTGDTANTVKGAIHIRAANGEDAIIENNTISNWVDRGVWIFASYIEGVAYTPDDVTVRNNTIHNITLGDDNNGVGINIDGAQTAIYRAKVYGNHIYDCEFFGITQENAVSSEIYRNLIHDCDTGGIDAFNYDTWRTTAANGSIHYNLIYNVDYGIAMWFTNTWTIANNTIYQGVGDNKVGFIIFDNSTYTSALTFVNNIIAGSWTHAIQVPDAASIWTQFDYNNITPVGTEVLFRESGSVSQTLSDLQGAGLMEHGSTSNPLLTSSYNLSAGSPAIDSGTAITGLHTGSTIVGGDAAGNTRLYGSGIDIGGYERAKRTSLFPVFLFANSPKYYTVPGEGDLWQGSSMTWQGESVTW